MGGVSRPANLDDITVLVVDDNDDTLELFSAALRACGAFVRTAKSAREALMVLRMVRANVLVSDLALPGEDGLWLIRQIRRLIHDQGGSVPAIAVTAQRSYDARGATSAGFDAFLMKPVDPFALSRTVAHLVGR